MCGVKMDSPLPPIEAEAPLGLGALKVVAKHSDERFRFNEASNVGGFPLP